MLNKGSLGAKSLVSKSRPLGIPGKPFSWRPCFLPSALGLCIPFPDLEHLFPIYHQKHLAVSSIIQTPSQKAGQVYFCKQFLPSDQK